MTAEIITWPSPDKLRWIATITYRTQAGLKQRTFRFNELVELDDIVEHGPHWDTIAEISVKRQFPDGQKSFLTIEEAKKL